MSNDAFDESGNLIIPRDAFKNIEIAKGEWRVKCPNCGHVIRMRAWRSTTKCKKCRMEVHL
jgi:predicted RNA-binding Zn-ribbon protein involved in translation (DUF1610 family)